jgi:hypothetical protein
VSVTGNAAFAASVTGWSLAVDNSGGYLELSVTSAVPEPEHIMLMYVGVLLVGFAISGHVTGRRNFGAKSGEFGYKRRMDLFPPAA